MVLTCICSEKKEFDYGVIKPKLSGRSRQDKKME